MTSLLLFGRFLKNIKFAEIVVDMADLNGYNYIVNMYESFRRQI